jgi:predicted glycogen debranching enzyme
MIRPAGGSSGNDAPATRAPSDPLLEALIRATRFFVVTRGDERRTVIAGYPWFGDWGRDTFIALPGLCLVTGRFDEARDVLMTFAEYVDQGMVPNRFPDHIGGRAEVERPDYNTVDAALWYIHAVGRYGDYTGDMAALESLYVAVRDILMHYELGTRHQIGMAADGLLAAGQPGVQLTWMDVKIGDWVVTPRIGKPVEINALWYNALRVGADLAERLGHSDDARHWAGLAARCVTAFNDRFWYTGGRYLYDVVDCDHQAGTADAALRPNQLLAISLTYPVLQKERRARVVRAVREALLTPLGLRTLAPNHPEYQPYYHGNQAARDAAYHRGTVWPWLLGPMVTAAVRAGGCTAEARRKARGYLDGIEQHLGDHGLEGVSEVADGTPPHAPGGCPWQAWSVAEPLRALAEDILGIGPAARRCATTVRTG